MTAEAIQIMGQHIGAFEADHGEINASNLEAFYLFNLGSKVEIEELGDYARRPDLIVDTEHSPVAKFIIYLYRYARYYTKSVLEGLALQTLDEFVYVAYLMDKPGMSKAELTDANIHERTTGMEIITRLLRRGMITQSISERDKRERVLELTDAGRAALTEALPRMGQLARHICGELTHEEVAQLTDMLSRLDSYHNPIFVNKEVDQLIAAWE